MYIYVYIYKCMYESKLHAKYLEAARSIVYRVATLSRIDIKL